MEHTSDQLKNVGRTAGALMLVAGILAPLINFKLLRPGISRDFLTTAAGSSAQIRTAVLLMLVLGALMLSVAIVVWPVLRRYTERLALAVVALSVIGFATIAAEAVAVLNMLALSQAGAGETPILGTAARGAWRNAHLTNLVIGYVRLVVFGLALHLSGLVPRTVAAIALAGALLSTPAFVLPLLDYPFTPALMAPIGITQLVLMGWLLVKGFSEPRRPPGFKGSSH